jgi:hypothetical protein
MSILETSERLSNVRRISSISFWAFVWTGMKTDPVSRSSQPLMSFEENLSVSDNGFPSREYAQGIFIFQFRGGAVTSMSVSSSCYFSSAGLHSELGCWQLCITKKVLWSCRRITLLVRELQIVDYMLFSTIAVIRYVLKSVRAFSIALS